MEVEELVEAILVDARPELKYQKGTIPSSINIPDTNFEEFYSKYDFLSKDKNKEIIVYCGGFGVKKSNCCRPFKDTVKM